MEVLRAPGLAAAPVKLVLAAPARHVVAPAVLFNHGAAPWAAVAAAFGLGLVNGRVSHLT
jgi:hypothetical protein